MMHPSPLDAADIQWRSLQPVNQQNTDGLQVMSPALLQDQPVPERRWLVPDWMPWLCTTALYGDGGMGKSLLAMMLMTAVATGKPWLGRNVEPVKVLGFFCEDTIDELHRRQKQINVATAATFQI